MTRPRFLADHDLNKHIIHGVLAVEPLVEFIRAWDVGLARAQDTAILQYTSDQSLLVVTHDARTMPRCAYSRLAEGLPLSGLLVIRQKHPVAQAIDWLLLIWSASDAHEWRGHVTYLPL